jgi:hypothetical protein
VQRTRMVAGWLGLQSVGMCQNNMAKPGWWAMTGDWEGGTALISRDRIGILLPTRAEEPTSSLKYCSLS